MATVAYLPIVADRAGPCVRLVKFVGLDLTGIALRMQVRIKPDTPGTPLIDLVAAATNAEGLAVTSVDTSGNTPVSIIQIRINETTMKNSAKVPYMGEIGDPSVLAYDLIGTFGNDKRRLLSGEFVALATVFGSDNAPASRGSGSSYNGTDWASWTNAQVTYGETNVTIAIDGMDLVSWYVGTAKDAADRAASNRAGAELAAATALAASRYYPSKAAGEAASTNNQLFSTDDGAGNIIYYRRTASSSVEIGRALTPASLATKAGAITFDPVATYPTTSLGGEAQQARANIQVVRDRVTTFEDFGAKGNGLDDDGPAIQAALASSTSVSGLPNRLYRVDLNVPLLVRRFHTIAGTGGPVETTTNDARESGFKFLFTGTASSCFANFDPDQFLSHGTFRNFAVIANANYGRIFDLRNVVGMRWTDVWIEARGNATAGLYSTKSNPTNPSWVNWVTNCYFRLPDASTQRTFDHDWSDTSVAGSYFTGGTGVIDRGYGARYSDCQFDRSSSAGLTIKKLTDTKGGAAVNCAFDANKEYGVVFDVNDDPSTNYDIGFQLSGNTFRTCDPNNEGVPGIGQVGYRNSTGHAYTAPAQRSSTFLFPKAMPTEYFITGGSSGWSLRTEIFGEIVLGRTGASLIDANGVIRPGANSAVIYAGNGSPEGVLDGGNSSFYQRMDGGAGTRLYVKTTSLGTRTGWVPFA